MTAVAAKLNNVSFSVGAIDEQHGIVYGGARSGSEHNIAALDLSTRRMTVVSPMSSSGFGWMSYADGWLVWAQGESDSQLGIWSIQVWNSTTHERRQITTSKLADGSYLTGELVFPVVGHGYVAWNQPVTEQSADLRVYNLATGKKTTLDSGRVSSPVFAGNYLVWAKFTAGAANPSFVFADAATLQPVAVPHELRGPREIGFLAGSSRYLVWTGTPKVGTPNNGTWFVDDLMTGTIQSYGAQNHEFQFPQLAGPFLVWFGADRNSVVDLRSGIGFDIPLPNVVGAASDTIVIAGLPNPKGSVGSSTEIAVLHPSKLSPLQSC
jgi:hypothetical protein